MGGHHGKYVLTEKDIDWFAKNTMISREDVKERYQQFLVKHPLGKMEKSEFIHLLEECYGKIHKDYRGLEKYIFETYDVNGDGWVDFCEFLRVIYSLSDECPKDKLAHMFRVFDINQTGTISKEELKIIVKDFFHLLGMLNIN